MDRIRTLVPLGSLAVCTLVLYGAWRLLQPEELPTPPALSVPKRQPVAAIPQVRPIRVSLLAAPSRGVSIEISGPFRIVPVGSERILLKGVRLPAAKTTATSRGLRLGANNLMATRIEIVPTEASAIWVEGHQYRGRVRLLRQPGDTILAVNVLPLDEYLASVVDSEMPADFPDEARKAQAIVARTYALYQMRQAPPEAPFDLYASTRSQKYLGFQYRDTAGRLIAGESAASRGIVEATRGKVCTDRGELFCTYYCAVCGGNTVTGRDVFSDAAAPLKSVPCNWCRDARLYRWTAEISKRDVQSALGPLMLRQGGNTGGLTRVSQVKTSRPEGVPEFELRGERKTVRVSGSELRAALSGRGLHSSRFTMTDQGKHWLVSGRGHGHGAGLCQWGARGQALAGKTCEQILAYYYSGAKVTYDTSLKPQSGSVKSARK
jgi:stage II sporulation protein D